VRSWIGKLRRDAHSEDTAHLLARRVIGTKPAKQTEDMTTGFKERPDNLVGLGNNLILIFLQRFCLLNICTRHRHCLSGIIDTLDRLLKEGVCKSVSKPVLSKSEYMAALPSSACVFGGLGFMGLDLVFSFVFRGRGGTVIAIGRN
jgi:hypothetical protein